MHPDIVVCELLAVESVAGKDKLKKVRVSDGEKEFTVVSNAPNVLPEKVGKRIVVARVGHTLGERHAPRSRLRGRRVLLLRRHGACPKTSGRRRLWVGDVPPPSRARLFRAS